MPENIWYNKICTHEELSIKSLGRLSELTLHKNNDSQMGSRHMRKITNCIGMSIKNPVK